MSDSNAQMAMQMLGSGVQNGVQSLYSTGIQLSDIVTALLTHKSEELEEYRKHGGFMSKTLAVPAYNAENFILTCEQHGIPVEQLDADKDDPVVYFHGKAKDFNNMVEIRDELDKELYVKIEFEDVQTTLDMFQNVPIKPIKDLTALEKEALKTELEEERIHFKVTYHPDTKLYDIIVAENDYLLHGNEKISPVNKARNDAVIKLLDSDYRNLIHSKLDKIASFDECFQISKENLTEKEQIPEGKYALLDSYFDEKGKLENLVIFDSKSSNDSIQFHDGKATCSRRIDYKKKLKDAIHLRDDEALNGLLLESVSNDEDRQRIKDLYKEDRLDDADKYISNIEKLKKGVAKTYDLNEPHDYWLAKNYFRSFILPELVTLKDYELSQKDPILFDKLTSDELSKNFAKKGLELEAICNEINRTVIDEIENDEIFDSWQAGEFRIPNTARVLEIMEKHSMNPTEDIKQEADYSKEEIIANANQRIIPSEDIVKGSIASTLPELYIYADDNVLVDPNIDWSKELVSGDVELTETELTEANIFVYENGQSNFAGEHDKEASDDQKEEVRESYEPSQEEIEQERDYSSNFEPEEFDSGNFDWELSHDE